VARFAHASQGQVGQVHSSLEAQSWHVQASQAHAVPQQHEFVSFSVVSVATAQAQVSFGMVRSSGWGRFIRPSQLETHERGGPYGTTPPIA
jgi:hypothetical protein